MLGLVHVCPRNSTAMYRSSRRLYSRLSGGLTNSRGAGRDRVGVEQELAARVCRDVSSINSRLENLKLTSNYLTGHSVLTAAKLTSESNISSSCVPPGVKPWLEIKLPSLRNEKIESPEGSLRKTFIQEVKVEIKEPEGLQRRIEEPIVRRIKKHAIRMVILRRRKMRKHRLKRLWDRMYLKFRASKLARRKRRELVFRSRLAEKVTEARKFDAEEYIAKYLEDFNTPLIPGTYKGKRLPQWLILELIEQDKQEERNCKMAGKMYTTKELIVKPGESVEAFIQRTWT